MIPPLFVGLGCRRCGSSWLHRMLNLQSNICKPESGLHFFSEKYDYGVEWFNSQYSGCRSEDKLVDLSVSYLYPEYCSAVADRIYKFNPDARLFVTVRNPVDRAFSDYLRSTRRLEIPTSISFEKAIKECPEFLERGLYGKMLELFYDLFGDRNIKVLFYDELENDPKRYLEELFGFIGVVNSIDDSIIANREPKGKVIASPVFAKLIFFAKSVADMVADNLKYQEKWRQCKNHYLSHYKKILSLNEKPMKLKEKTRKELIEYFYEDMVMLEKLTGRSLSKWYA